MRILHYSLGLPPYRGGGLTKYALDLMQTQLRLNHQVYLLYPGHYNARSKINIIKDKDQDEIKAYELVNPLPVPLIFGIKNPGLFYKNADKSVYLDFLREVSPDIIHVHTLMGMHKEFFQAAKELNIKIVYTTHDYFCLCPTNLMDHENRMCSDFENGEKCKACNRNSYHILLIYFMQTRFYMKFKRSIINNGVVKKFIDRKLDGHINLKKGRSRERMGDKTRKRSHVANEYVKLRKYNLDILSLVDIFHFNSSIAKELYNKFLYCEGDVIGITHCNIADKRIKKDFGTPDEVLHISYIGPFFAAKGFSLLIDGLNKLKEAGVDRWHLNIYGEFAGDGRTYDKRYYSFNGSYHYDQLEEIFKGTDLLIIPSTGNDTFSFLGLEAISHGVPVIVSETVGFKDIIKKANVGIVIEPTVEEIARVIDEITRDRLILKNINENILKMDFTYDIVTHTNDIINLYKKPRNRIIASLNLC